MHEKTSEILELFENINKIPRCSKNETAISGWLKKWAENNRFEANQDKIGNLVITVPATQGYENAPIIVLQGHMDMVCEKTPDSDHDFTKDPIQHICDGDWLKADKTTLGADNGIGIAISLALAADKNIAHPKLELLLTVDEETGLTGANKLEPGFIEGRILINLDSENEGVFTVGCAGGRETEIILPLSFSSFPGEYCAWKIMAHGMAGGHSGIDIIKPRANANKILAQALDAVRQRFSIRMLDITGGSAHNAIPREAEAVIVCSPSHAQVLQDIINEFEKTVRKEYSSSEKSISVTVSREDIKDKKVSLTSELTDTVINLMLAMPHGVAEMCADIDGLVETSGNFAIIKIREEKLHITSSQRSSVLSRLLGITAKTEATAALAGAKAETGTGYPAWQPDMDSPLLKRCKTVYENLFNKEPVVETVHAGLECGVIGSKYEGTDMISIGPVIENPHSPDEKLYIPSVAKIWDFLAEILRSEK
ncbi:MAG: aminoacyl-histidine dipeptidase [Desulfobacteraceae bacterium]|nr:aminoacyl-histidine dipeptidase [Desulfobacteraceae bacterium]